MNQDIRNSNQITYKIHINGKEYGFPNPSITGADIKKLAGVESQNFDAWQKVPDSEDVWIPDADSIPLTDTGRSIPSFYTQERKGHEIFVDQKSHVWNEPFITGAEIKGLAGLTGADARTYDVYAETPGTQEDLEIEDTKKINLTESETNKFFTVKKESTEGGQTRFLPPEDREYLQKKAIDFDEHLEKCDEGEKRGIILKVYQLPEGKFDKSEVEVLIYLPPGYPDAAPDMFYLHPCVRLSGSGREPSQTSARESFGGRQWQRWSRHWNDWRPGVDGIRTLLMRIEHAIEVAK